MAGHGHSPMDPAFIKLNEMQNKRYQYFRWTPRTARISFMYIFVVPSILGMIAYKTDGLLDFRGKRKGDSLLEK
ncbi:hypothetical protein BROUX41_006232 [Berkeleyomyces rouxiae]|uniref:uncharacterized protein n=1 Tax=Berkeleyomyces rouxiae TaxID=2035830 RepID=UPI003B810B6F